MINLKDQIINDIETIINNNQNGCTIYKILYNEPYSIGIISGTTDACYIFKKDTTPKIAIFVGINYSEISLLFYKYKNTDGQFSKKYVTQLFDNSKIEQIIQNALEQIEF